MVVAAILIPAALFWIVTVLVLIGWFDKIRQGDVALLRESRQVDLHLYQSILTALHHVTVELSRSNTMHQQQPEGDSGEPPDEGDDDDFTL